MDAGTLELVEIDSALDFEPRCESVHHEMGRGGHSGPAAYLQLVVDSDCPASAGLRCAAYVQLARKFDRIMCSRCGARHELRWIPIQECRNKPKDVNA